MRTVALFPSGRLQARLGRVGPAPRVEGLQTRPRAAEGSRKGAWARNDWGLLLPCRGERRGSMAVTAVTRHRPGADAPTRGGAPAADAPTRGGGAPAADVPFALPGGGEGAGHDVRGQARDTELQQPPRRGPAGLPLAPQGHKGASPLQFQSGPWSFQPPGRGHWSEVWVVLRACPPARATALCPPRHSRGRGPGWPGLLPWFRCCRSPWVRWRGDRGQPLRRLGRSWEAAQGGAGEGGAGLPPAPLVWASPARAHPKGPRPCPHALLAGIPARLGGSVQNTLSCALP